MKPGRVAPLPLHDNAAEVVHRVAERTGYAPAEIVTAALEWHLQHDEPDHEDTNT
ncbi:hypothetical protein [Conexibacter woesei]|uniref:Uncharacterized protein n=1 Tax=Conexibacter woesei (strain DSM 14684 / CCUG 47730 / CIP 108061 / JCM 11494 / NBRC 100937 / ID131577) TaxID=469383 RepID=D3F9E6_CONWI|nr:hypothetical protein [Conexibacter woesei]ADB49113.1 hypothetical protein Cwoe_0679 [Conexibacter woesei DSM 14684]